jgi:large subunit ribosomal protein L22
MEFISTQKYIRISPKKIRDVASLVKGLKPLRALEVLPFVGKRGALPLEKTLRTAIANAKQKGVSDSDLSIKEIQVMEGPRLKRGIAASRGRWHPIKKRMSHIKVVLISKTEVRKQAAKSGKEKGKENLDKRKPAKVEGKGGEK